MSKILLTFCFLHSAIFYFFHEVLDLRCLEMNFTYCDQSYSTKLKGKVFQNFLSDSFWFQEKVLTAGLSWTNKKRSKSVFLMLRGIISKCKLESCPYWTKTCPHWTYFGSKYPKNRVGLALNLNKNFNLSKVLLAPKFNNN